MKVEDRKKKFDIRTECTAACVTDTELDYVYLLTYLLATCLFTSTS
jgi:hypothetical protein